jgi:DNA-binding LacI/PurR family transcriptional regulator
MRKKHVTLQQVAKLAGVAPITVSRVLNNTGYVSPEKRERVLQAAQTLNYTLHAGAKELASRQGQATMIAVVLPQLDNPFFVRVLEGCQRVADEANYDVLIYNTRGDYTRDQRAFESLLRRRVEGLIYAIEAGSDGINDSAMIELVQRLSIPVVFVEHAPRGYTADVVMIDNEAAGYEATVHLIQQGCRRIALIASPPDLMQDHDRLMGYRRAIKEHGLESLETFIPHNQRKKAAGQRIVNQLLDSDTPPDGIFAASTLITIGVFQGLKERGVEMPEQISLIGYGEAEWVSLLAPSLSVVSRPAEEVGEQAARLILERIEAEESEEHRQIMLPAALILRESSSRIRL